MRECVLPLQPGVGDDEDEEEEEDGDDDAYEAVALKRVVMMMMLLLLCGVEERSPRHPHTYTQRGPLPPHRPSAHACASEKRNTR